MWEPPATAWEALPHVVAAARRDGYLGLMIVLARTAEARTLHDELIRDWTSIHDVTGQRIAVLCPNAQFVPRHANGDAEEDDERWRNLTLDMAREWPHADLVIPGTREYSYGRPRPLPPRSATAQQAAWTEAVTRCADYFGIHESRLPAVLVLCFHEELNVLVQLRQQTSIYQLCKRIASHPGYEPGDDRRMKEILDLTIATRTLARAHGSRVQVPDGDAPKSMHKLLATPRVGMQFEVLRKHVGMAAHVDPALIATWSNRLDELVDSDADYKVTLAFLAGMADTIRSHPRKDDIRHVKEKVHKAERGIKAVADPPPSWRYVPESPEATAEREAKLARTEAELAELERVLASRPALATACEAAARAELGACEVGELDGAYRAHHWDYSVPRIRVVSPIGPSPDHQGSTTTSNDISGPMYGTAIQAGHIGAVHVHAPRRWFDFWRKRD